MEKYERASRLWRANLSLRQDVSLNGGVSKRLPAWVCEPLPVVKLETPCSVVKLETPCARKKSEDAARTVHERIMNGRTDKDVDELRRISTIINPASVILLISAPAGLLFDAHWRSRHRGTHQESVRTCCCVDHCKWQKEARTGRFCGTSPCSHPGRTDLERISVGPMTQNAYVRSAPSLTWEQGIQPVLDLETDDLELDDVPDSSTLILERAVARVWELRWPRRWRGPCHSIHDGAQ